MSSTNPTQGNSGAYSATPLARPTRPRHPVGKYARVVQDPTAVVRTGYMTQDEADIAWRSALRRWDITATSEDQREELKDMLTHAMLVSTSTDLENLNTRFQFEGVWYDLRPLSDAVQEVAHSVSGNYLRMFVRSYGTAEFAVRMVEMLMQPGNIELRQDMALRCGGKPEHAYLMIDTFDAYIKVSGRQVTADEIALHQMYKSKRLIAANSSDEISVVPVRSVTEERSVARGKSSVGNNGSQVSPDRRMGVGDLRDLR